ncbi:MAG: PEP-CTERM sorting domain-containing protein [Verrucomicrobiota bacterium]
MALVILGMTAVSTTQAVIVWEEDFEGATLGGTSGNNQTLAGTVIQTANAASSVVVDASTDANALAAATAFNTANGGDTGQFISLSVGGNGFEALRPSTNPDTFAQVTSAATYTMSFDIYIPTLLGTAVGDWQPRFKLSGVGGNGSADASGAVTAAGFHNITYTGQLSDFIATDVNEHRSFIGFDQAAAATDILYIDNISLDITAVPEPSAFALLSLGALGLLATRRRK